MKTTSIKQPTWKQLDPKADKLLMLAKLLNDSNKNWRLEIWRKLATMPKSQIRENFKALMRLNKF